MALWRISSSGPTKIDETRFKQEQVLEEQLEDWITADSSILGEPLLVIGRQVLIPDMKDRLDLLALDTLGNTVVIELKRGKLKEPVDIQAMRYASYISKWGFADLENTARNYLAKTSDPEFNFNAIYESFCEDAGVDEIPDLNNDQRLIIVGSSVRDKLGSVALWLFEHGVDIKVMEVRAYKDGDSILIEPDVLVPLQVSKFKDTGKIKPPDVPWISDGKGWHLNKRCSPKTREILLQLDQIVQDHFEIDGPKWNQKHYVAYRIGVFNWLSVITTPNILRLDFLVRAGSFKSDEVAGRLKIARFDKEESLSEKLGLPSSVFIKNRNEKTDRMYVRVKEDLDIESEEFLNFLKEVYKAFPR